MSTSSGDILIANDLAGELRPELARDDPKAFVKAALGYMSLNTVGGALLWNTCAEQGIEAVALDNIHIDPRYGWWAESTIHGITLGAEPMPEDVKSNLIFGGERFSYADQIAYQLLHETVHRAVHKNEDSLSYERLRVSVSNARLLNTEAGRASVGLTALGSQSRYQGMQAKIDEDIVELMTIYGWGGMPRLEAYLDFLAESSDAHDALRAELGLARIGTVGKERLADEIAAAYDRGLFGLDLGEVAA